MSIGLLKSAAAWAAMMMLLLASSACSRLATRAPNLDSMDVDDSRSTRVAFDIRSNQLRQQDSWQIVGRLAFSSPQDSGSGRIEWMQQGDATDIRLSAPVSRQSWQLLVDSNGAHLLGLEDGSRDADSADELLQTQFGFAFSLSALSSWLRGTTADGPVQDLRLDAKGRPISFSQDGWRISYPDWYSREPIDLPRRVFAERTASDGRNRVRVVIDSWQVAGDAAAGSAAESRSNPPAR